MALWPGGCVGSQMLKGKPRKQVATDWHMRTSGVKVSIVAPTETQKTRPGGARTASIGCEHPALCRCDRICMV